MTERLTIERELEIRQEIRDIDGEMGEWEAEAAGFLSAPSRSGSGKQPEGEG